MPCNVNALKTAISTANGGGGAVLALSANCTYSIVARASATDSLPPITGNFGLVGGENTVIRRSPAALSNFRVLEVSTGALRRVSNLSIVNGKSAGLGGGVLNGGTLWIRNVTFFKNMASSGGALSNSAGATAILDNATMSENTTTGVGGGGIINFGTLTLTESSPSGNRAPINTIQGCVN